MTRTLSWRRAATLIADNESWLVWVYGVPLLISSSIPLWLLAGALGTVPLFWFARRIARGQWSVNTPLGLPIGLFLVLGLMAVAVSIDLLLSVRLYAEFVGGAALYFGIVNGLSGSKVENANASRAEGKRFARVLWVLLAIVLAMGFAGALGLRFSDKFLPVQLYPYLPKFDFSIFNPRGFTPNIVAGAIAPAVPLCWLWGWRQPRAWRVVLYGISFFLLGVIVLTQSRGAVIGIAVSAALIAFWLKPRIGWVIAVLLVGATALFLGMEANRAVDSSPDDSTVTAAGRFELWSRALYIAQDFPFTGIGLGTFSQVVPVMYPLFINSPDAPIPHAHNMYLQMAVDYGVGGFVAFGGMVLTVLLLGAVTLKRTRAAPSELLVTGLVGGYIVFLAHGMLDAVVVSTKVSVVMWIMVALLTVLYRNTLPGARYE